LIKMMKTEQNEEQAGRCIYGLQRAGSLLALLAERMGKPLAPTQSDLAVNAAEADVMFARLPASDAVKAEFSALMRSLASLSAQRDRWSELEPEEMTACHAEVAAAVVALPQFRAIADHLLGGP
jgi:hypothetical protein